MRIIITFLLASICLPIKSQDKKLVEIRGIYGNPDAFWQKDINLTDLGVNAVFVHSGSINKEMMERVRQDGVKVFSEFATLNGKNYVEKHPEAWAINDKGEKVETASWFMGVCPTDPGFKQYRMKQLEDLIQKFDLDGIWMDYVHWHAQFEEPEPILPETCFCDHCLKTFQNSTQINIPQGKTIDMSALILKNFNKEWRDWRCSIIAEWAREMKAIVKQNNPEALLGIYHCPWDDKEFEGARREILGLDYDMLRNIVDVFSPMVYHGRMGRSPEWVKENTEWFCDRLKLNAGDSPKVWPIVQAYNDPKIIPADEFSKVLRYGLAAESTGVMMFTTWAVAEDPEKIDAMKGIYTGINGK